MNDKKNLIPILLFICSYLLIQLYHFNQLLFLYTASALALIVSSWQLNKWSKRQKKLKQLASKSNSDLTTVELHQLLKLLFKKQGYQVEENEGIAAFLLKKNKKKTSVFIQNKEVTSPTIQQLINYNQNKMVNHSFLVCIEGYSLSTKKLAHANRITLINENVLDAMKEHILQRRFFSTKQQTSEKNSSSRSVDS
ncbi:hypothetical protein AJ85_01605 [Alkalihalobacillus alcalophilus ATCC 27647 = CGMCC 1.3604]|uniref:Restriction endonuclease type IV Mrr domain-containing protein n=1 Tax=Alkalihalobacillus alcalophilus ATCC 27647 = CGMCC 1.3604 TaxID=1218173 RepID=A0A4S4JU05_ALKAL|nr:restriction endonuclease [Alkalihalobacillus alcalophilus]MED1560994.1 restriction endonuclease [Alkalihalobacillus alcalophilus]THG88635.1 hypothetical protein AJ85_01605 [Alkalihalobacillus alcalophilus ATCC 27647 = CGMCC 1.3604]